MAKVSPVSIKYMVHANFICEGALEKPDVIGAIFGQTEGLLGSDLEMRELQKEGKIGRIEVDLERNDKKTTGTIYIPTALDQSETTLIAAAVETIERIGPCDAQIEVEKIEDVRGTKRDYIIERAKKLMMEIHGSTDSREISKTIKESAKMSQVQEYGKAKLPCGNLSGKEVIVVEGRADVLNLMRHNIDNVIAMNGTKLPEEILELGKQKEITLFVDGDRGGQLIIKNVLDNTNVKYIATAPDGKEVEELTQKEALLQLRKKIPVKEMGRNNRSTRTENKSVTKESLTDEDKAKLKDISDSNEGSGKAIVLNNNLETIKSVSSKTLSRSLSGLRDSPFAIVIDGTVTAPIIRAAEESQVQAIIAKNFSAVSKNVELLSL